MTIYFNTLQWHYTCKNNKLLSRETHVCVYRLDIYFFHKKRVYRLRRFKKKHFVCKKPVEDARVRYVQSLKSVFH